MHKPKVFYDPTTDSLSINLANRPAVDNEEIADNVIVGFDKDNQVVLIEFMGGVRSLFSPLLKEKAAQSAQGHTKKG